MDTTAECDVRIGLAVEAHFVNVITEHGGVHVGDPVVDHQSAAGSHLLAVWQDAINSGDARDPSRNR